MKSISRSRGGSLTAVIVPGLMAVACSSEEAQTQATAIWPPDAIALVAVDRGDALGAPAPEGSECESSEARFEVAVSGRAFSWRYCGYSLDEATPWRFTQGARVLGEEEAGGLTAALHDLTATVGTPCGADKQTLELRVIDARGERRYLDGYYACRAEGRYLDGMDAVFRLLRAAAARSE
jgi:hypothetical protein